MKNKTAKNLAIATVVFLGATYILEKYVKDKKRQKMIEQSKNIDEENTVVGNEVKYVSLGDVYKDVVNGKIVLTETYNGNKLSDQSVPKRKYHVLKMFKSTELSDISKNK